MTSGSFTLTATNVVNKTAPGQFFYPEWKITIARALKIFMETRPIQGCW